MTAGLSLDNHGRVLAEILADIRDADRIARQHDYSIADRDFHAEVAQRADERAEAAREAARMLIEQALPGISWSMIADAAL